MQALQELESAAKILLAPPSVVSAQQRSGAEYVFMNFRQMKTPYGLCKNILENSGVDYVLFECGSTLKTALLREWDHLQPEEIVEIRQYLLEYTLRKPTLAPFVREKLLQVISVMVKRQSANDFGASRTEIIDEVERLIMEGDLPRQMLGCCLLMALCQEHSVTAKSSDIKLSLRKHFAIKSEFQNNDLPKILKICVRALTELTNLPADTLLKQILALSETVLSWQMISPGFSRFLAKALRSIESNLLDQYSKLELKPVWRKVIFDTNLVNLFFDVFWKLRENPYLGHYVLNCLVQLSSVKGTIFDEEVYLSKNYYSNYIELFIKLITNIRVLDREALGIAYIFKNLSTNVRISTDISPELYNAFLENFTRQTIFFMEEGIDYCENGGTYSEGLETLLRSWILYLPQHISSSEKMDQRLLQACSEIFQSYLKRRLAPPAGTREPDEKDVIEDVEDEESTENLWIKEQIETIGFLGEQIPEFSIPLLMSILEERVVGLRNVFEEIASGNQNSGKASEMLNIIYDDLNWIIKISCATLTVIDSTSPLPQKIMEYSCKQKASVENSLKYLVTPISEIPLSLQNADHVVRIVASILQLTELEIKVGSLNLQPGFSTQIVESLTWFFKHWSRAYLMPNEEDFPVISMALNCAFGTNSEGALWMVNKLLEKIQFNLRYYRSEAFIIQETVELLFSLVNDAEKSALIIQSEGYSSLVDFFLQSDKCQNLKLANCGVMRSFITCGYALDGQEKREQYWNRILKPITERMNQILNGENFKKTYQDGPVINEIQAVLELVSGAVLVSERKTESCHLILIRILSDFLNRCPELIAIYSHSQIIIENIFQLFSNFFSTMPFDLCDEDLTKISEPCIYTIQMFARINEGRKLLDPNASEDQYNDLISLMDLAKKILLRESSSVTVCAFYETKRRRESSNGLSENSMTGGDVCLIVIKTILPLMTVEFLKYPTLIDLYYSLLSDLSQVYPRSIINAEPGVSEGILQSIKFGLQSSLPDVDEKCCLFIYYLGKYIYKSGSSESVKILVPFIDFLLDMVLCLQIEPKNIRHFGDAIFVLMCCYKDDYNRKLASCIESQQNPEVAQKLAECLTNEAGNLSLKVLMKFADSFEKFYNEISGFLFIK